MRPSLNACPRGRQRNGRDTHRRVTISHFIRRMPPRQVPIINFFNRF